MGGIPVIAELLDVGFTFLKEKGKYLTDSVKFIVTNFRYDNPMHLLALSMIFFLLTIILLGLFSGGGGSVSFGSGDVMASTTEAGAVFTGDYVASGGEDGEDQGDEISDDQDNDGIPDSLDPDIDGDELINGVDYDADGDYIPNDQDNSPCGSASSCNAPVMCGNGVCDSFNTSAGYHDIGYNPGGLCSDRNLFYNIPEYCLYGSGLDTVTDPVSGLPYFYAKCGLANTWEVLGPRCVISGTSIYYVENAQNCPADCSGSYTCFRSYTCFSHDFCSDYGFTCCPFGSYHMYKCTNGTVSGSCNDPYSSSIQGLDLTLAELINIPYNCDCVNNASCAGDWGGSVCCGDGTLHESFCYDDCNS